MMPNLVADIDWLSSEEWYRLRCLDPKAAGFYSVLEFVPGIEYNDNGVRVRRAIQ